MLEAPISPTWYGSARVNTVLAFVESTGLFVAIAAGLGSLVGSFLNVVIVRLPAGENIAWPGSHCPSCKAPIHPLHNLPVLSWLWLRGKCASCGVSISPRYVFVEVVTAALFAACASRFGLSATFFAAAAFCAALIAVTFIDLKHWEIPDEIVLYGLPAVLLVRPLIFDVPWWSGVVGALLGAGFILLVRWTYFALRGVEAMGLGDVKLLAFIGGFLGVGSILPTLTLASLIGALIGALLILLASPSAEEEEDAANDDEPETWAQPPKRFRVGGFLRTGRRTLRFGLPEDMVGRTFVRFGVVVGTRLGTRRGFELLTGVFQDVPGWGHFEGWTLGHPPRVWFGPLLGARLPDVEAYGDDEEWVPPPTAIPFGPFLALGALTTLFFAAEMQALLHRWVVALGA